MVLQTSRLWVSNPTAFVEYVYLRSRPIAIRHSCDQLINPTQNVRMHKIKVTSVFRMFAGVCPGINYDGSYQLTQ